ncbi:MAG TPA: amidohydrolase [Gemmatimonadales bacterium]|jgi:predicted amidohydrolase YtcJ|nr:amidohydrolase [Gemmatimonadales bacterium]
MTRSFVATGLLLLAACGGGSSADTVITDGMVWTGLSSGDARAGAVAIRGGKIIALDDSAAIRKYIGSATQVIDAHGGLVMPGFADGHTHFVDGGFQLASLDLRDAATPQEFIRRVAAFAKTRAPGQWILGGDWDHTLWPGQMLPRREWIDSVTPNNPVFINRLDGHEALANTAALKTAGVTKDTPTPSGGEILRDARTGEPTGIFKDQALDLIYKAVPEPTPAETDSAVARALAYAASLGVTATANMSASWAGLASYRRLERAGRMTLRVYLYLPIDQWRAVADTIHASGAGDEWVRIGGLKGFMDGSAGARTAYFFDAYNDSAGYHGLLQNSEQDMRTWIGNADSAGLQIAVHAIGDRANAILLAIYDSVARVHGTRDRRFRVEHAQHLRREDIARFGQGRIVPSMQPYHAIDDGRWVQQRIGPERIKTTYAFRNLLDTGAPLAFGSDWTVATIDPLWGVYAAVTRRTLDNKNPGGWVPEQKITLAEALKAYTAGNAWGVFAEHQWGTLAPGLDADVVVLDHDLFKMAPESLATARVSVTIVGGKVVYRKR